MSTTLAHSLLVVRLMTQIETQMGQKIPLATLFQEPTIEHLAKTLRQRHTTPLTTPLIALQPNGAKLPFFCVHSAAGSVLSYLELARVLAPDQPVHAFQAVGLAGEQPPHTRIEEMAAAYLAALRTAQSAGPYLLGGWSFGGLVAYEMACHLTAQGHQVGLLALFDNGVHVQVIPGDHYSILRQPQVATLANQVRASLDEAQARGEG